MKELKEQLQKSIRQIPKFDELQNHIDMTVTNEGLRIELTESASGVFFESGSDRMSGDGSDLVRLLAQELGKLPNPIAIEGHTDSKPYPPAATYTNWELSSDRANSARRLMQNNGLRPDQITQVRGFANQRLRKPDAPLDPSYRRISLIVQYMNRPADGSPERASGEGGRGQNPREPTRCLPASTSRKHEGLKIRWSDQKLVSRRPEEISDCPAHRRFYASCFQLVSESHCL
jgi:chemotaxis protein MotB